QSAWEEINVVDVTATNLNLGWNTMEGPACFESANCDQDGLTLPVHAYGRDGGCSITGGYVYRGSSIPALGGRYLFADFCSGNIQSLVYANGAASDVVSYADT